MIQMISIFPSIKMKNLKYKLKILLFSLLPLRAQKIKVLTLEELKEIILKFSQIAQIVKRNL